MMTYRTARNGNRVKWISAWIRMYGGTVHNAARTWIVDYRDNPNNWGRVDGKLTMIPMREDA